MGQETGTLEAQCKEFHNRIFRGRFKGSSDNKGHIMGNPSTFGRI